MIVKQTLIKTLLFVTLQFNIVVRIIQTARGHKIKMKTGRLEVIRV